MKSIRAAVIIFNAGSPPHRHNLRAAPGAGSASSGSSPSHLGPPKARIMSISWKAWASLGSSIIEFAGAAPRRPKTCPDATRNARTFRSHSPANFEFPRPCRRPRRGAHHEHQRDPRDAAEEGRRQRRASLKGFAFTASPSSGGPRPRPQKGPAADFRVIPVFQHSRCKFSLPTPPAPARHARTSRKCTICSNR